MGDGCSDTDTEGRKVLSAGGWNQDTSLELQGGQAMHFHVSNVNVLGTTIEIRDNFGHTESRLIPPMGTTDLVFAAFGSEPMGWKFDVSTNSDAFSVTWCLYSTWAPTAAPVVDQLEPSSGSPGETVTIKGSGFASVTAVGFGAVDASVEGGSDTELTVTVPQGTGTVDVTVSTPSGTSAAGPVDKFTYVTQPVPVVDQLEPSSGSPGDTVTIKGSGFANVAAVGFGSVDASVGGGSDTELTVTVPQGSGTVDVTVSTSAGTSPTGAGDQFTYLS